MKVRLDRYRNWGPVTCLETGKTYPNPNEASRAIGYKSGGMVRMSVMLGKACKGLHFADGRLAGDELEKARQKLEMEARQNFDRGGAFLANTKSESLSGSSSLDSSPVCQSPQRESSQTSTSTHSIH